MASTHQFVWHRLDLRLQDNPALHAAALSGKPVIPIYIFDNDAFRPMGAASRWWLHHSLMHLSQQYGKHYGMALHIFCGSPKKIIPHITDEWNISSVYTNKTFIPPQDAQDKHLHGLLQQQSIPLHSYQSYLLHQPDQLQTQSGTAFRVFTPFWKQLRQQPMRSVLPIPPSLPLADSLPTPPASTGWLGTGEDAIHALRLLPSIPWDGAFYDHWQPGEAAAHQRLHSFIAQGLCGYASLRNRPDLSTSTSRLSPHLHFGEITPAHIWQHVQEHLAPQGGLNKDAESFLSEIAWREFSFHLLQQFPTLAQDPLRTEFNHYPWRDDPDHLSAWQKGQTGYPLVDAGMRELWHTGWMHNRVRMVVASFLIKHLRLPWQLGEQWFWDTLLDADAASNAASWQWVAGCGADAAPYFRIFNPISQGETFDPNADYIRRWVPELRTLPNTIIHAPWQASPLELQSHGIRLGKDYPYPIVDHPAARQAALAGYEQVKAMRANTP